MYSTPLYFSKIFQANGSKKYMVTAAMFTVPKFQNQPRYSAMEEWMRKMEQIHTVGFSIMKKNDTCYFSGKWMPWKIII